MAETHSLAPAGVVEAVIDGVEAGVRDFGLPVNLIGILSRTYGPEVGWQELESLLQYRDHLVGLDLAGDEANWPGELFVRHFQRARDVGWHITIHAGEAANSQSIWQAVRELGATRIGHAVSAIEDPALMDYMAEHNIAIESSLTSNVQTSTVRDYASHPARHFLSRGLLVTLNTDDPGISGIDLRHEYEAAAPAAGLTRAQIHQSQRNATDVAFLPDSSKEAMLASKAPAEGA
jgi:adenosine deaminase